MPLTKEQLQDEALSKAPVTPAVVKATSGAAPAKTSPDLRWNPSNPAKGDYTVNPTSGGNIENINQKMLDNPYFKWGFENRGGQFNEGGPIANYIVTVPQRTFWENPQRVGRYYQALKALPPGTPAPSWLNPNELEQAYNYFRIKNGDLPWTMWGRDISDEDPVRPVLQSFAAPPELKLLEKNIPTIGADGKKTAPSYDEIMSTYDWSKAPWDQKLPAWQYAYAGMTMTGPGRVANAAIQPIVGGALAGLVSAGPGGAAAGALAGLGFGAVAGVGTAISEEEQRKMAEAAARGETYTPTAMETGSTNVLQALNWLYSNFNKASGYGLQLLQGGETAQQALDNPGAAYQAGTYTFANLMGSFDAAYEQAIRGQTVTGGNQIAKWTLGVAEPEIINVPNGMTASEYMLSEATKRIIAGASPEEADQWVRDNFGVNVEIHDLIAGYLLDPMDRIAPAATEAVHLGAKIAGNEPLVRATANFEGIEAVKQYGQELRNLPPERVAQYGTLSRLIAGVDDSGNMKAYVPLDKTKLWDLDNKSRATQALHTVADGLAVAFANETNPDVMMRILYKVAKMTPAKAAEAGDSPPLPAWFDGTQAQVIPNAIKDQLASAQELKDNYDITRSQAQIIQNIANSMGVDEVKLRKDYRDGNAKNADDLFRVFVDGLKQKAAAGDKGAAGLLASLPGNLDGQGLKKMVELFDGSAGAPFTADEFATRLGVMVLHGADQWSAKWFKVAPSNTFVRLTDLVKQAQGWVLLGFNPTYLWNNSIDNLVKLAYEGVLSANTGKSRMKFWKDMGFAPVRLREGIGASGDIDTFGIGHGLGSEIANARTKPGKIDAISKFMHKGDKYQVMQRASSAMEQWSSEIAMTTAARNYWELYNAPGKGFDRMPPDLALAMDAYQPGLSKKIENAIARGKNKAQIEAEVLNNWELPGIRDVLSPDEYATLSSHFPEVFDTLDAEVRAAKSPLDVQAAFAKSRNTLQTRVGDEIRAKYTKTVEVARQKATAEGMAGVLDIADENQSQYGQFWLNHFKRAGEVVKLVEAAPNKIQKGAIWQKFFAEEDRAFVQARNIHGYKWLGIFQGLGADNPISAKVLWLLGGSEVGDPLKVGLPKDAENIYTIWGSFFAERRRLFGELSDMYKAAKDAEIKAKRIEIDQELNSLYVDSVLAEDLAQTRMDTLFADLYQSQMDTSDTSAAQWRMRAQNARRKMAVAEILWRQDSIPDKILSVFGKNILPQKIMQAIAAAKLMKRADGDKVFHQEIYPSIIREWMDVRQGPMKQKPPAPTTPPSELPAPSGNQGASIPLFITNAQKAKLREQGYSPAQVKQMLPQEAHDILNSGKPGPYAQPKQTTTQPTPEEYAALQQAELAGVERSNWIRDTLDQGGYGHTNHLWSSLSKYLPEGKYDALERVPLEELKTAFIARQKVKAEIAQQSDAWKQQVEAEIGLPYNQIKDAIWTDPLTQIGNRLGFEKTVEGLQGQEHRIISFDLRGLKNTNDLIGHPAGDLLLRTASIIMNNEAPGQAYRMGGDEFNVIVKGGTKEADRVMKAVNDKMRQVIIEYNDKYYTGYGVHAGQGETYVESVTAAEANRTATYANLAAGTDARTTSGATELQSGDIAKRLDTGSQVYAGRKGVLEITAEVRAAISKAQQVAEPSPDVVEQIQNPQVILDHMVENDLVAVSKTTNEVYTPEDIQTVVDTLGEQPLDPTALNAQAETLTTNAAAQEPTTTLHGRNAWEEDLIARLGEEQAGATMAVLDQFAARYGAKEGLSPDEWYNKVALESGEGDVNGLNQDTTTPAFRAWFGDSKVVDAQGMPLTVYHQTTTENAASIYDTAFDISKVGARGSDGEVPDGIFMKPASNDIGIKGSEQMPLYVKLENPYQAASRYELTKYLESKSDTFYELQYQIWEKDRATAKAYDDLEEQMKVDIKGDRKQVMEDFLAEADRVLEEGNAEGKALAAQARALATKILKDNGYDGVIIEQDAGSFGRKTKTIIAFDNKQVKSINNRGTFDPNDPNILRQQAKGATYWNDKAEAVIRLAQTADVSTAVHEAVHAYTPDMDAEDAIVLRDAYYAETKVWHDKDWNLDPVYNKPLSEWVARGFERYLYDGPTASMRYPIALQRVFAKFRNWLFGIYKAIEGSDIGAKVSDAQRAIYDKWMGGEKVQAESAPVPPIETSGPRQPWQMTRKEWEVTNGGIFGLGRKISDRIGAASEKNSTLKPTAAAIKDAAQFWEVTQADARKAIDYFNYGHTYTKAPVIDWGRYHKPIIEKALREGKPIPPEVLADYPDLQQAQPAPVAPVEAVTRPPRVLPREDIKRIRDTIEAAPWEIALQDYLDYSFSKLPKDARTSVLNNDRGFASWDDIKKQAQSWHKKEVEFALANSKTVPAEVLADYPDLRPVPQVEAAAPVVAPDVTATLATMSAVETQFRAYLEQRNWKVSKRNPKSPKGEADLIKDGYYPYRINEDGSVVVDQALGTIWAKPAIAQTGMSDAIIRDFSEVRKLSQPEAEPVTPAPVVEKSVYVPRPDTDTVKAVKGMKYGYTKPQIETITNAIQAWFDLLPAGYKSGVMANDKFKFPETSPLELSIDGATLTINTYEGGAYIYKTLTGKSVPGFEDYKVPSVSRDSNFIDRKGELADDVGAAIRLYGGLDQAIEKISSQMVGMEGTAQDKAQKLLYALLGVKNSDNLDKIRTAGMNPKGFLFQEDNTPKTENPISVGMPRGTIDSMNPAPIEEANFEGYLNHIGPMLDKAEGGLVRAVAEPKGTFNIQDMSPADMRKLRAHIGKVTTQKGDIKIGMLRYAEGKRDAALLNYNARYGWDNVMGTVFPYQFWYTHSLLNWALRALNKPGIFTNWARIRMIQERYEREGYPTRLNGKIGIPAPFLPSWMGGTIYTDPMSRIFSFEQMATPFASLNESANKEQKGVTSIINGWMDDSTIPTGDGTNAISTSSGPVWEKALAQYRNQNEADIQNPWDFVSMLFGPSLPIQYAANAIQGRTDKIGQLPLTRLIQNMTAAFGVNNGMGWNAEGPIRKMFGMPTGARFEDYYLDRELTNLVGEGLVNEKDAQQAMIDRTGPIFAMAQQRVGQMNQVKFWGAPLAADIFPEGEKEMRALQKEYAAAGKAQYEDGVAGAMSKFFDEHPEYEARLQLWKDPETRMRQFLISSVWEAWNSASKIEKKVATEQFGPMFQDAFINKETRSYDSIDVQSLAQWARMLKGQTPDSAPATPQGKLNLPDQKTQDAVNEYYATINSTFPQVYGLQTMYYNLPEGSAQRKQFLAAYPDLKRYWDWRKTYQRENPEVIPFVDSQETLANNYLTGLGGQLDTQSAAPAISPQEAAEMTGPLVSAMSMYWLNGNPLSAGAKRELQRILKLSNRPMNLDQYLAFLKTAMR